MMVWLDAYVNDLVIGGDRLRCRPIASDLVCAAGAMLVETLTLILSLWQRERRAFWSGACIRPFKPESTSDGTAA